MNARLAKPIPFSLVYCQPVLLFATPSLMPLKSSTRAAHLIWEDLHAVAAARRRDHRPP
jgi:hypothetical protein